MVMTSGLNFFSTPLASAVSRILRATSRVSSAINLFLWIGRGRFRCVETHREHARDMDRFARCAIPDLVAARRAVGHDDRTGVGTPYGRQQRQFGHLDGGLIGLR